MTAVLTAVSDADDSRAEPADQPFAGIDPRLAAARAALAEAEAATGLRDRLPGPGLSTSPTLTAVDASEVPAPAPPPAAPAPLSGVDDRTLPVPAALAPLFPAGALPRGSVVQVSGSTSVLLALAASTATDGGWCAFAAMPHIGWRAAHGAGLALERVAVVPSPGPDAAGVVGALTDGFDVLVVGRCPALAERDRRSLTGRIRTRGAVLLTTHSWPGAHLVLRATRTGCDGLGQGWGHLTDQHLTVRATGRAGASGQREVRVLAGLDGLRPEPGTTVPAPAPGMSPTEPPLLRAV